MIKVLVVDDHPIFRSGAAAAIAAEPDLEVVGEAASTDEAIEATRQFKPDIVLTDIRLDGDTNGIELARRVKEAHDDVGIVVLTNYSNEPYIRAMMESGVGGGGYMMKDTPPRDVIEAIRMVMEGRTVFSSSVTETLVRGYLSPAPSVQADGSDESRSGRGPSWGCWRRACPTPVSPNASPSRSEQSRPT